MNSRVWYSLLVIFTSLLVVAFIVFRHESLISFEGISPGTDFFNVFIPKYIVKVIVEYSTGYSRGDPFHPAVGVAVFLVSQVYTSSAGEAIFVVPRGSYTLSAENPVGHVRWSGNITVQGNKTARIRFDSEKILFADISVTVDFTEGSSKLELKFTVPKGDAVYLDSFFLCCLDSNRKLHIVNEKLPSGDNWLKTESLVTHEMILPGSCIIYVFPEISDVSIGLVYVEM